MRVTFEERFNEEAGMMKIHFPPEGNLETAKMKTENE